MLSLSEMQVFAIAAETENFSEAARRLHLSQPAVSQRIHSLEQRLGVKLFLRSGPSVRLTNAGQVLLPMARELLEMTQRIEEKMWSLEGQVAGHLVIGCTTTAGKYALPLLAAAFNQNYPNVQMTIEMCNCPSVEEPLLAREVHLGISNVKIVQPDIEFQLFFTDYVVLVVPAGHPFADRSSVRPADLLGELFILREQGCSTCQIVREGLAGRGIALDQLDAVMVVGNSEAIEAAVEHGLGVAFISRLAARHGIRLGDIVEVPVDGVSLERPLYVVRNSNCAKTPAEARLWDFVKEQRKQITQRLEM